MSDLFIKPELSDSKDCPAVSHKPIHQIITAHNAKIGENLTIRRALPHHERRMIGAWCFLDHFGPLDLTTGAGLDIGPHPHIGLQTFTWTISGEILHRDSLGSEQIIQPGQINLMTAGEGISHSEESLPDTSLHGVQLWIALPDSARHMQPNFIHYSEVQHIVQDGLQINLLVGEMLGMQSPTKVYSPMMGAELTALQNTSTTLPLNTNYEYGILPLIGNITVEGETIEIGTLMYLGCGRSSLSIDVPKDSRILIIGGEPFAEEILIWWNFVARTQEEIVAAVRDWNEHRRFGDVKGYVGNRLNAP